MTFTQELEKQINTSLIVLGSKIKALKSTLSSEQLKTYDKTIQEEKVKIQNALVNILTQEEIDAVLKAIDN